MDCNHISDKRVLTKLTHTTFALISETTPCTGCNKTGYVAVNWEENICSECKPYDICIDCGTVNNFNKKGDCQSNECRARRKTAVPTDQG